MINEEPLKEFPIGTNWDPLIKIASPDEETTKSLMLDFFNQDIPTACSIARYSKLTAMAAIYINCYLRNEALPSFKDKPNAGYETRYVEWITAVHGVPIHPDEIK